MLELGCGWGSLSLYMAAKYPGSAITAVSNSRTQKEFIDEQARCARRRAEQRLDVCVCAPRVVVMYSSFSFVVCACAGVGVCARVCRGGGAQAEGVHRRAGQVHGEQRLGACLHMHASTHAHAHVLVLLMVVVAVCAPMGGRMGVAGVSSWAGVPRGLCHGCGARLPGLGGLLPRCALPCHARPHPFSQHAAIRSQWQHCCPFPGSARQAARPAQPDGADCRHGELPGAGHL